MGLDEKDYPPQNSSANKSTRNNSHHNESSNNKDSEYQVHKREEPMSSQQRTPVRPKESMRDIMYGGGIGADNENPQKVSFRVIFYLK